MSTRKFRLKVVAPTGTRYIDTVRAALAPNSWSGPLVMNGLNTFYDPVGSIDPVTGTNILRSSVFEDREDHTLIDWQSEAGWHPTRGVSFVATGATAGASTAWRQVWWVRYNPDTNTWYKILRPNPNAVSNVGSGKGHNYDYNAMDPDAGVHYRVGSDGTKANGSPDALMRLNVLTDQFIEIIPGPSGAYANPTNGGTASWNLSSNPAGFTFARSWGAAGELIFLADSGRFWAWSPTTRLWRLHCDTPKGFDNHPSLVYHHGTGKVLATSRDNADGTTPIAYIINSNGTFSEVAGPPFRVLSSGGCPLVDLGHPTKVFVLYFRTDAGAASQKVYSFDVASPSTWTEHGDVLPGQTLDGNYAVCPMPELNSALVMRRKSQLNESVYMYRGF